MVASIIGYMFSRKRRIGKDYNIIPTADCCDATHSDELDDKLMPGSIALSELTELTASRAVNTDTFRGCRQQYTSRRVVVNVAFHELACFYL